MYPGSLETVSGRFYPPRVSAVWPGPHALTTRVKRCEPANTGFRRCGTGHTKQGCLSSGVACVARIGIRGSRFIHSGTRKHRKSHVLSCISLVFGFEKHGIPILRPDLEGPGERIPKCKPMISVTPKFSEIQRLYLMFWTSDPTLPSRAHPQDDVRRQATPSNELYTV